MTLKMVLHSSAFLLLFFSFSITTYAQAAKSTISGKVIDDDMGVPLEYATVSITKPNDPEFIDGGVTDINGNFSIAVPPGTYNILIEFLRLKLYIITLSSESF
jgi:hypothetical protein